MNKNTLASHFCGAFLFIFAETQIYIIMKKVAKILWIIVGIVFLFTLFIVSIADSNDDVEPVKEETREPSKEWSTMTYEERQKLLEYMLENREFEGATDLSIKMRHVIQKELQNPKTSSFELPPYIYEGLSYVLEADSGWIYTPFKLTAKNDFGIEKEIMGSIIYEFVPESKSLKVHKWDMNQND